MRFIIAIPLILFTAKIAATNVNPDGSYSYQVEINIPNGTAGLQPKLAISYNSSGTNGIIGNGFSLTGIQMLSRINNGSGINYNGLDTYSGPGGKLVDISGSKTLFHTEQESFSKYVPTYGNCGAPANEPCSFTVTDAAGTIMEFGVTSDSRNVALGRNGAVRIWALNKLTDLHGNFYTVQYATDNGEIYPEKIIYTQNAAGGISRYRTVEFSYDTNRPDYFISYASSSLVQTKWRLTNIIVKTGVVTWGGYQIPLTGDLVRRYQLNYQTGTGTGRSRLNSIQEFGSDNTSALPAQVFGWQDGGRSPAVFGGGWDLGTSGLGNEQIYAYYFADVNSDGKTDFIAMARNSQGAFVSLAGANGVPPVLAGGGWDFGTGGLGNEAIYTYKFADFNGDGRADLMAMAKNSPGAFISLAGANGIPPVLYGGGWDFGTSGLGNEAIYTYYIGDFNGDGKSDLLAMAKGSPASFISLSGANGVPGVFGGGWTYSTPSLGTENVFAYYVADFNSDGKSDLMIMPRNGPGGSISLSGASGIPGVMLNGISEYNTTGLGNEFAYTYSIADFNGDGKNDLMAMTKNSPGAFISFGGANGIPGVFSGGWDYTTSGLGNEQIYSYYVADFNGDSKSDLMAIAKNTPGGFLSLTGTVSLSGTSGVPGVFGGGWDSGTPGLGNEFIYSYYIADLNSDGKSDLIAIAKNSPGAFVSLVAGSAPDRLSSIQNGRGSTTTITYTPATQVAGAVAPATSTYPNTANSSPRLLTTMVTVTDGRGASYATSYQYSNGRTLSGSFQDRKDLGFEWMQTTKPDGQYTKTFYNQTDPDTAGSIASEQQYDATGSLIANITNTFIKINPYPGTKMVLVSQKQARAYEAGTLVHNSVINMTYDSYGFLSERTTTTTGFTPIVEKMTVIHNLPFNIFGHTTDIEVYSGSLAGPKLSHQRSIYNGSGAVCGQPNQLNLVCEKQAWLDKNKNGIENRFIAVKNTYSPYGLLLTTTDALNHSTQYVYDGQYQTFPVGTINAKGHSTTRAFDAKFGVILSETDAENGVTVSQEYDVFGRQVRVIDANGTIVKQYFFINEGNPNTQYVEVRLTDDSADGFQWSREYTDGLSRIYKKEGEGFGISAVLRSDTTFDALGRKFSETNSYVMPGGTPRITSYTYDSRSRIASISYPENRADNTGKVKTLYAYGTGFVAGSTTATTTATDAKGNGKTLHKDARGQTIRIEDPAAATIRHTYDHAGKLTQTIDADGNIITIEYDSLGRKIRMVEPNSGTTVYRYDDAGNLAEQIDGKAQTILFNYDELNRVTFKNLPGSETDIVYQYDLSASTYGKRRLSKITDAAGTIEYNYDKRGNMSAWKRTIDSYAFTFEATYDSQNRLQQTTYPDGYKARNYFSDAGNVRQVRLVSPNGVFGSALVTYQGPETTGQAEILRNLGNGVTSKIGFDDSTHRPTYVRTYLKNDTAYATPVQNLSYAYDDIGNLQQITDQVNATRSETYTYDSLYRLTVAQSGMYGTKNYAYTAGGNLTQNGNLALYFGGHANCTSGGNQPTQAVCADSSGNQYNYDLNGNMTQREGRALEYDSEDRLIKVRENAIDKLTFVYNYAGERIKKTRSDNAVTYSIGGLYDVQKKPDGSEVHTKYFTGIKGDRVAQVTKDSSTVTLASVTTTGNEIYLASGRGAILTALNGIGSSISYLMTRHTSTSHLSLFLLIVIGGMGVLIIRSTFGTLRTQGKREENGYALWQRLTAMPIMVCFLTVVFIDCSGSSPGNNGTPWETTTGSTSGIPTYGTTSGTYNDTTLAGMPITGSFFLVPNHLGSTTLVTDASGNTVVSQIYYEPYGQIVASASTGPDIIRNTYTGQVKDAESSLMYYGARYYDPKLARFITPDSVVPDAADSQAYNRYMYVKGNPVAFTDPTGHFPFLAAVLIGALIGGVLAGTKGNIKGWINGTQAFDWDAAWKGALAGAIAGAAGAWAGAALTSALGGSAAVNASLVSTILVGAASGGAAGFAGGATSAWLSGASFLEGLEVGFKGAAIGAVTGGALAGVGWGLGKAFTRLFGSKTDTTNAGSKAADSADDAAEHADDVAEGGKPKEKQLLAEMKEKKIYETKDRLSEYKYENGKYYRRDNVFHCGTGGNCDPLNPDFTGPTKSTSPWREIVPKPAQGQHPFDGFSPEIQRNYYEPAIQKGGILGNGTRSGFGF